MTNEDTSNEGSYELTRRDALAALAAAGIVGGGALALSGATDDGGPGDGPTAGGGPTSDDRPANGDGTADGPADTDGSASDDGDGSTPPYGPVEERDIAVLTAAAEVLYPSEVTGVEGFVTDFVRGRATARPDHAAGVAAAAEYVDDWSQSWFESGFTDLDVGDREAALDRLGAREADPDPEGSNAERVRYYVVDELLFALYASPTGGRLVGIENPQGHPGGVESYRRGPRQ